MTGDIPIDEQKVDTNALNYANCQTANTSNISDFERAKALRQQEDAARYRQYASSDALIGASSGLKGFGHSVDTAVTMRHICLDVALRHHPGKGADEIIKAARMYYDFLKA